MSRMQKRHMFMEPLEPRMMLSISALLDENKATFIGDNADDQLWLRVGDGGQLEFSSDGTVYSADLIGGQLDVTAESSIDVNLGGGADTLYFGSQLAVAVTIDGGDGTDRIVGPDRYMQWALTGAGAGELGTTITWSGFENVTGGNATDQFVVRAGGSVSGTIDGGDGDDELIGPDADNTWTLSGADSGLLNSTQSFAAFENLTGGKLADHFDVLAGGSLSGLLDGGLDNDDDPADDTLDFSACTSTVDVDLSVGSAGGVSEIDRIEVIVGGSGGNDTLAGPGEAGGAVAWKLTGANAGEVEGTGFSGFENLQGQGATSDSFYFEHSGSLSGLLSGGVGAGTSDGFSVSDGTDDLAFMPSASDASGSVTLAGRTITYAGMDTLDPLSGDLDNLRISGSNMADNIVLEDADPDSTGRMMVTFPNLKFTADGVTFKGSYTFDNPKESLTIEAGSGADKITVKSLDPTFAADLLLYGDMAGRPLLMPDMSKDEVRFEGEVYTHGGYLEAFADKIVVAPNATVSTLTNSADLASGRDIVFRARRISTVEIENQLPSGYLTKSVSIDIGAGAKVLAAGIELIAQAEDMKLATMLGLTTLQSQFFVDSAMSFLNYLTSLPAKVLIKGADAKVTIGAGAELRAEDAIRIQAIAGADASSATKGTMVSLGYSQANASATIDILDEALIEADGPINITSNGSAVAKMVSKTKKEESGNITGDKTKKFAASVAVSNARLTSKATVAETAEIHGGRTVNVRAMGEVESEAESESALFADGTAALAMGFQFSFADILTTLAGTVTSDMSTPGGEVVKFEFDPTTVDPANPGYIDYDNDRILVYSAENEATNWVVRTGDAVDYSPRRGNSIGGMIPGTYYIIRLEDDPLTADVDESHYVQLARTELNAIDGIAIDLKSPSQTLVDVSLNTRSFDSSDVDVDKITLRGIGNTFELGQAVIYREPGRTEQDTVVDGKWVSPDPEINGTDYVPLIEGLEHGGLYYVMTAIDQFNLIGDQRLVDGQTLQLGALENETRGGIARIKLGEVKPGATGFTLRATQILDSTLLTFGGVSQLEATDKAIAAAGMASEKPEDPSAEKPTGQAVDGAKVEQAFTEASKNFTSKSNTAGANARGSLQVGGALAFSYTSHSTKTLITGTADLNSNDDMELTSFINENLQINAESSTEEQKKQVKGADGKMTEQSTGTAAPNSLSAALLVGIENNSARVIAEGASATDPNVKGARMDSMRALRLLSGVTYPFLTRPDEFVPDSAGELIDKLKGEGLDGINTYMDGTLGLKSGMVNTWACSTTSAENVGIAGSINVLVFNNVAESIVETGVEINQDPFYHPDPRFHREGEPGYDPDYDPSVDNDNITHSRNANNVDEHVVSIEATNYIQFIDVTGVFEFKLPSVNLALSPEMSWSGAFDHTVSGSGSSGGKGGAGGAIFLKFLNNTTHAIVEDGVKLYSGKYSGLNMKAEEAILGFDFAQAGADAGKVGVGGAFSYVEQNSDILAHLSEGSVITGGRVDVYAGSLETQINWVGGVAKSKAIGAGLAVAINNTDRKTRAIIGEEEDSAGTDPATGPLVIDVAGTVTARAAVSGDIYAFTVASASANSSTSLDKTDPAAGGNAPASDDPLDGVSLPMLFDEEVPGSTGTPDATAAQQKAGTAVGIAGAVAVNHVTDVTQASLSDATVHSDAVDVKAINRNDIMSGTGGLAYSKTDAGSSAAGLAGAFSYNSVDARTDAFIRDADMTLTDVPLRDIEVVTAVRRFSLTADNAGQVWTAAAGMAGAMATGTGAPGPGTGGGSRSFTGSLAGSVSWNVLTGDTQARMLDSSLVMAAGEEASDALVEAKDSGEIIAIAGGLSMSIAKGSESGGATAASAGAAIAVNYVTADTNALVESTPISWGNDAEGSLGIKASSTGSIKAFTMAGALSAALSSQQGSGVAAAGAGSGSVNKIDADTTAILRSSTVAVPGDLAVQAENDAEILAAAGGIALAISSSGGDGNGGAGAFGAGFAVNFIGRKDDENQVLASIDDSIVTTGGAVHVTANATGDIFALTIGAAGSMSSSGTSASIGGSVSINSIYGSLTANIVDTTVTAGGAVGVTATDTSSIEADGGGVAFAISLGKKPGKSTAASVGVSVAKNVIGNVLEAYVSHSTLTAEGDVDVKATSEAEISAVSVGGGVAVAAGKGNSTTIGVTGVISLNSVENSVSACINGGSTILVKSGDLTVQAADDSTLDVKAFGASIAVSLSSGGDSKSITIGVSTAKNDIDNTVAGSIENSTITVTLGDVTVDAKESATIDVLSLFAAVSVAGSSGGSSLSISGGGAIALNNILGGGRAFLKSSTVTAGGDVSVTADNQASIEALVPAISVSVAVGSKGSPAVSIGVAVARNLIGWGFSSSAADYTNADLPLTVHPGDLVEITDGPLRGDVYEYVGETLTDNPDDNYDGVDLSTQNFGDRKAWKQVNLSRSTNEVLAYSQDSTISAGGDLTLLATASQTIEATIVAASVGVAASSGGAAVSVSGAGTYAENKIASHVASYIDGDGTGGVHAKNISLTSDDGSSISSVAAAAAVAAAVSSTTGVGVSIGLSLAFNEINTAVDAYIGQADDVRATTGDVSVSATSSSRKLFERTLSQSGISAADLDDAAEQASDDASTTATDEALVDEEADQAVLAKLATLFKDGGETLADVESVRVDWLYTTADTVETLKEGSRVRLGEDYANGGIADRIYRFKAPQGDELDVELGGEDYSDTTRWERVSAQLKLSVLEAGKSWTLVAPDGASYTLTLVNGKLQGHRTNISAISAAASIGVGAGSTTGVAVSGAGAAAINSIRSDTNAYVLNSSLDAFDDVSVSAANASIIDATIVAASLAVGVGGTTGAGVSIGIAVARNFIGYDASGDDSDSGVRAYLRDSSLDVGGDLTVQASAEQTIDSVVFAGSAAVGAGGTTGLAASGSGVWSENKISMDVMAYIRGDGAGGIGAKSVTLTADDHSEIKALAGAASVAVALGGTTGVAVSIGVAMGMNSIDNRVVAYIQDADQGVTTTDDINISAQEEAAIDSIAAAASLAAGFGGTGGVAVSGAGAVAQNYILGGTKAYMVDSIVASGGKLDVDASDTSAIKALIVAASAGIGVGGTAGAGVSIGFSMARNFIGWGGSGGSADFTSDQELGTLENGKTVRITTGPRQGDIYKYLGTTITDGDPYESGNQPIDLVNQNFQDNTLWQQMSLVATPGQVLAYSEDSTLTVHGALTLDAKAGQTIDATIVAASVALAAGGTAGVAASGAGVFAQNKIDADVKAYILGDGSGGIHAGSIQVTSDDGAGISAIAGAASVAASVGGAAGVSVSIGLAMAFNEISGDTAAYIQDADSGVTTTGGGITVAATAQGRPVFTDTFNALDVTPDDLDDAATADSDSSETLTLNESNQDAAGDMAILAKLRAAFELHGLALAVDDSVATAAKYTTSDGTQDLREGTTVKLSSAYGHGGLAGRVYRYIGADVDAVDLSTQDYGNDEKWLLLDKLKVAKLVEGSSWTLLAPDGTTYILTKAGSSLSVSRSMVNVVTAAASLAAGFGGAAGIAVSGAGAVSQNVVLTHTNAFVDGSKITSAGDMTLNATSQSLITSLVVAASVAIGGGGSTGVGASIGIAVARNYIGCTPDDGKPRAALKAYVEDSTIHASGTLTLGSLAQQTIDSLVFAGSAAVAAGGVAGVAASGSGVYAENKIAMDIKSYVDGDSLVGSQSGGIRVGKATLTAQDESQISSVAAAFSLAASLGGTAGVSVSVGVALARNTIDNAVAAYVDDAGHGLTLNNDDLTVQATEKASICVIAAAASLAIGFGGAAGIAVSGAGADASNVILGGAQAYIENSVVSGADQVDIDALNQASVKALIIAASATVAGGGAAGVGASVGVALARNFIGYSPNPQSEFDYTTNDVPQQISTGDTVKILQGARAGDVYEYVGEQPLDPAYYAAVEKNKTEVVKYIDGE